ncbi:MAG: DUF3775 domain-containing protein [Geminicoccaceae bacterium]|nr:DUF3775 domain-containing protein [Geminicoccaceae bacterium]
MQAISLASVCRIVLRARSFDADMPLTANEVEDDLPGAGHAPYDMLEDDPDQPREDTAEQEIRSFIAGMNVDERAELVALAWVGRGSYAREEWDEAVRTAREEHGARTADYLLDLPLLADYLEEGLAAFDLGCQDLA